jgi:hypothetical protein
VQVVGDGKGGIVALGERECSLQRRSQKIVELAPSPASSPRCARRSSMRPSPWRRPCKYRSLGTFEFLVEGTTSSSSRPIRACRSSTPSPKRCGASTWCRRSLRGEPAERPKPPRACDPARVNMETMTEDGSAKPGGGTLTCSSRRRARRAGRYLRLCRLPHQSQLRFAARQGDRARRRLRRGAGAGERALAAFRLEGAPSNIGFLRALLADKDVRADKVHTRFVDEQRKTLIGAAAKLNGGRTFQARRRRPGGGDRPARGSMRSIRWQCWPSARLGQQADAPSATVPEGTCRCRRRCRAPSSACR